MSMRAIVFALSLSLPLHWISASAVAWASAAPEECSATPIRTLLFQQEKSTRHFLIESFSDAKEGKYHHLYVGEPGHMKARSVVSFEVFDKKGALKLVARGEKPTMARGQAKDTAIMDDVLFIPGPEERGSRPTWNGNALLKLDQSGIDALNLARHPSPCAGTSRASAGSSSFEKPQTGAKPVN